MRWVAWMLAGPMLWALLFAVVYALHGVGCARGWPDMATPLGSLHVVAMAAIWLTGLALHLVILLIVSKRGEKLSVTGAWIGLVASLLSLSPIILVSSCS